MLVPVPCILRIPWLIDFLMRKAGRQEGRNRRVFVVVRLMEARAGALHEYES